MASINNVERFKQQIREGHVCIGTCITFSDPAASELVAEAGYDFTWIDAEHGPLDMQTILGHIMALRGTNTAPLVRVRCNDVNVIKPVLDLAPAGIVVPLVKTGQDVLRAVQACKYPPIGVRGYGPRRGQRFGLISMPEYLKTANEQIMVFVQIEHVEAVKNLDDILAVPGLDGVCLGPNDLSGSMGKLGQITDNEVVGVIDTVVGKTRRSGLFLGIAGGYDPETLAGWLEKGIQWITLNTDWANMFLQSKMISDAVRHAELDRVR
jgi:2-dehydro-3-deoxyglucarate aldolase/4-hydroxy-2-oxoheptanedioate aldolase